MPPNYALERSVTALSERAAGAQKIVRLRRAGCASRGPLNADVRPQSRGIRPCSESAVTTLWNHPPLLQTLKLAKFYVRG